MKLRLSLLFLFLSLIFSSMSAASPAEESNNSGWITGKIVTDAGKPIGDGVVSFFPVEHGSPIEGGIVRRIPNHVVRVDPNGTFKAELPAGSFFIGAMQRERGKGPGPPRPGEKFLFVLDNKGALRTFDITGGQTVAAGELSGAIPKMTFKDEDVFIAEGRVTYEDGRPFVGALVTVKNDLSSPRPLFISAPTDASGRFSIKLPGGIYYFAALDSIHGGRPGPGSYIGGYGGGATVKEPDQSNVYSAVDSGKKENYIDGLAVQGKAGETNKAINIIMSSMPDPESIRNKRREKARALPTSDPENGSSAK